MTLVREAVPPRVATRRTLTAARLIAVGVRDPVADAGVLRWALADALPGDVLHIVHAYVPLRLDRCQWEPVRRERDHRALAAQRVVARAIQLARTMRVDLAVDGSAVAGLPDDVLVEFSQVVDLLVIGDDSAAPTGGHRIAWRVQDLAACPVVSVPAGGAGFDAPVTVVVDERGLVPEALGFAVDWAQRHGHNVRVSRSWASLHEGERPRPAWLAHQAEELDSQVSEWQRCNPHVGIVTAIETCADWPLRVATDSSLIVAVAGSGLSIPVGQDAAARCATVVVPA